MRFNTESEEFYRWNSNERLNDATLLCLEQIDERDIVILNRFIVVPDPYVNQYVFATLNLQTATIVVTTEHEGRVTNVLKQHFPFTI